MAALFVGLDLGGSGTRAALANADGEVLATGLGPSAGHAMGASGRRQLARSVAAALAPIARRTRGSDCVVWAGTTGLSIPGRRDWLALELTSAFPGGRVEVSNDAHIALWGGLGAGAGVAVLAGTGSIAMARSADGRLARAGGWGYLLGDEGSAYGLGRDALRAALGVLEGRAAGTPLTHAVLRAVTPEPRMASDLITWANAGPSHVGRLAGLASLVTRAAAEGDASACEIVRMAGEALAEAGTAAAHQLSLSGPVRVVTVGGVWSAGGRLREAFRDRLLACLPQAEIAQPALTPVLGAVLLAMDAPSTATIERLRAANRSGSTGS
jgi:N-acetylglucosamine kinase-like BadF-type ATPase